MESKKKLVRELEDALKALLKRRNSKFLSAMEPHTKLCVSLYISRDEDMVRIGVCSNTIRLNAHKSNHKK